MPDQGETNEPRICPLARAGGKPVELDADGSGQHDARCLGERCAWWANDQCGVLSIAGALWRANKTRVLPIEQL